MKEFVNAVTLKKIEDQVQCRRNNHVSMMAEDRLAKIIIDNRLAGKILLGRQRKRWKESLNRMMAKHDGRRRRI